MNGADRSGSPEINFKLLHDLASKPHPLINYLPEDYPDDNWVGEVVVEARTAHHLLDMVGIPRGKGYSSDLDARTYLAISEILRLQERLNRIADLHAREQLGGGLVGLSCVECATESDCDTRLMTEGRYVDPEEDAGGSPARQN